MIDLPPVRFRVGAGLLDLLLAGAVFGAIFGAFPDKSPEVGAAPVAIMFTLAVLTLANGLAHFLFAAPVGLWLLSSRLVVYRTGKPAGLVRVLLRQLLSLLFFALLFASWWSIFIGRNRRGWQDRLSGTMVIADASMDVAGDEARRRVEPPWSTQPS